MESSEAAAAAGIGLVGVLVYLAVLVFYLAVGWKIFTKAGKPGWAVIIPFYNTIVHLEIVGKPWWWLLLMFVPVVNLVVAVIVVFATAKAFGKGVGFGFGLLLLGFLFAPILAFGSARYVGPDGAQPVQTAVAA